MRRMIGFMVTGLLALLCVPSGAMMILFGVFPGEAVVTAAQRQERVVLIVGGAVLLIGGALCAIVAIHLRPRAADPGPD